MSWTKVAPRGAARTFVVVLTSLAAIAATSLAFADGIDVSHYQGSISWTKVKSSGVAFAFMKATEGTTYTDPRLAANWSGAQSVGIYRGAYHFARPSPGTAAAQARYFVSRVGSFAGAGTLPPVLDLETTGGMSVSGLRTWTSNWLTTVESLTGRTPMIYVSPAFWEGPLGNSTAFTHYPLWIANYGVTKPRVPGGWNTWTFWQYTSSGSVSGISGNVDKNKFNGTSAQLAALANTTGGTTDPVPTGPSVPTGTPTNLTMTATPPAAAAINDPVTFAGDLTQEIEPAMLAAAPVAIWARTTGTPYWTKYATGTTDAAGHYSITFRVPRSTDYEAVFAGDPTHAPSGSTVVPVTTPPRTALRVDLHKNKHYRVRKGATVLVYGHVRTASGPVVGQQVRFYRRPAGGGHWTYLSHEPSVAPNGWYARNVHPRRSWTYKVVTSSTLFYVGATSNLVTVWVRR